MWSSSFDKYRRRRHKKGNHRKMGDNSNGIAAAAPTLHHQKPVHEHHQPATLAATTSNAVTEKKLDGNEGKVLCKLSTHYCLLSTPLHHLLLPSHDIQSFTN
jgi:hypothetical protein